MLIGTCHMLKRIVEVLVVVSGLVLFATNFDSHFYVDLALAEPSQSQDAEVVSQWHDVQDIHDFQEIQLVSSTLPIR